MLVFISKQKLHVSAYSGHLQVLRGDDEISTLPRRT